MKLLLRNAKYILTLDPQRRILTNGSISIDEGRITDVGKSDDVLARQKGEQFERVIDCSRRLLMPGLINTHAHLHENLVKGLFPDNIDTTTWTLEWAYPYFHTIEPRDEYASALLTSLEMLRSGTTSFIESGVEYMKEALEAVKKVGIRAALSRLAMDRPPLNPPHTWPTDLVDKLYYDSAEKALADQETAIRLCKEEGTDRTIGWVALIGKRTCTKELYVGALELSQRLGVGYHFHMASSLEEAVATEKEVGCWPITFLENIGALGDNAVIAHAVALKDDEIDILRRRGVKISHCPGSALKLAKGMTKIGKFPEMLDAGITVGLGCDGACSSGSMDMVREMYLAATVHGDARMKASIIGAETAVEMATIHGARAMGLDNEIGSLEVGKKADMIAFNLQQISLTPQHDIVSNLVFSSNGQNVDTVLVDGEELVVDGKIVTVDVQEVIEETLIRAPEVARRASLTRDSRWPVS